MNKPQRTDNGYYYLGGILDELIETYYLIPQNAHREKKAQIRDTLFRTIKSICADLAADPGGKGKESLWKKTEITKGESSKPQHLFSAEDKQRLLESERLKNYLYKRCTQKEQLSRDTEEQRKYEQIAEAQNKAAIHAVDEIRAGEYVEELCEGVLVTSEELRQKKLELMIEALYLRYFEPIDEKKLREDMVVKNLVEGTNDHDADSERALERLKNHAAYCHPRKQD